MTDSPGVQICLCASPPSQFWFLSWSLLVSLFYFLCWPSGLEQAGRRTRAGPEQVTFCPGRGLNWCPAWPWPWVLLLPFPPLVVILKIKTQRETNIGRRHSHIIELSKAIGSLWFPGIRLLQNFIELREGSRLSASSLPVPPSSRPPPPTDERFSGGVKAM